MRIPLLSAIIGIVASASLTGAEAQEKQGGGDLRAATQNPISSLVSLPFKFTFDNGAPNGDANFLNIQPVYPVTVGDWNFVNRLIVPLTQAPGGIPGLPDNPGVGRPSPGGSDVFGLGDINYSLFLSPVDSGLPIIWGAGGSITVPTATDSRLGSGKTSIGPTGIVMAQPSWGSVGILGRQLWSVAGPNGRQNVNNGLIEPFVNYNLDDGWYLISDSVITVNWQADQKWTVPVGGGAGKIFKIGDQAMNARAEAYYNVVHPDAGPEWTIGATLQFLFPK